MKHFTILNREQLLARSYGDATPDRECFSAQQEQGLTDPSASGKARGGAVASGGYCDQPPLPNARPEASWRP
jgi:hypothetical protein